MAADTASARDNVQVNSAKSVPLGCYFVNIVNGAKLDRKSRFAA